MRAVWYTRQGPPAEVLELGERPAPEPAAGEVRVRLFASAVNPSDCNRRAGRNHVMEFSLVIPNSDGAGVVDAVGEGVDPGRIGQRVWLYNAQRGRPFGTAAEFTCVPADLATELPEGVTFEEGACLGIPAMTAHRCLFADGQVEGLSVLVSGGGGAVGNYAVQLAKWGGAALVLATASGGWKSADAAAAGADRVIDHRREDVARVALEMTGGRGVDRVVEVEFGGNVAIWSQAVARNGAVAAYASAAEPQPRIPFAALMRRNVTLRGVLLNSAPIAARRQAQADILAWLRGGRRLHRIAGRFPLAGTAAAHAMVEAGGKRGTVVVLPAARG
ncbi:NADPH:quinone oxidoreductase [Caldovatus sediminis]|uniref:NADPH:quinone oxidoreductase n=1 Tax=Caldovatus sediminis TaxID=2041189 RepID=A0A8J2ZE94_9PROT|nr:NADPH:quinone reductase [Caldovatus sediminis]GGG44382.1 NADPH:quinone oxidoreductase [Caldovatus sediminis]